MFVSYSENISIREKVLKNYFQKWINKNIGSRNKKVINKYLMTTN
jgi:hypothetical protein